MIYARGTGDGIAWNGGERGTGGRQKGDTGGGTGGGQEGDWGGGTGGRLEGDKKKGGKPQSLRLTSLHL